VEIPVQAIRRQIAQAVHLIVFIRRLKGGRRLITQLTEITGVHPVTGEVEMRGVMAMVGAGQRAELRPTGYLPMFIGDLVDANLLDPERWLGRPVG
jgi:hypothetical protein